MTMFLMQEYSSERERGGEIKRYMDRKRGRQKRERDREEPREGEKGECPVGGGGRESHSRIVTRM